MGHKHPVNQKLIDQQSRVDRGVDRFVAFFGSLKYLTWQTIIVAVWVAINGIALFGLHWDPYPFILLNLIFSTQASYAAPLILLSQNRAAERDRLKAEHDYQVNEESYRQIQQNTQLTREIHAAVAAVGLPQLLADLAEVTRTALAAHAADQPSEGAHS